MPPKRKNGIRDMFYYQCNSGTKVAYDYSKKKGVKVINVLYGI